MKRRSKAERLVREVCRAVDRLDGGLKKPWVNIDKLAELVDATAEQLELAIGVADQRGWLDIGGKPPHSVALTEDGREAVSSSGRRVKSSR